MTELINALRDHQWLAALIIAIPLTIGLAKVLLKNTSISAWAAGLPSWVRWGAANLASGATVFVALVTQGVPIADAILGAVLAALGVEGVFNAQKHARSIVSTKARGTRTTLPALLLLIALPGCLAGSFEEARLAGLNPQARAAAPPPTERCVSLDSQHRNWGGVSKISAVLAGGSGLSTIPAEDKTLRIGLAAGAAATAALAAGAGYLSESAATSWARECQ
jgi:hypothetical protein